MTGAPQSPALPVPPLAYDPRDPAQMRLPVDKTCGDCFHIRRCKAIFGHTETDRYCDWSPSRFRPVPAPYVDPKFVESDRQALLDQVQMQHMTGRVAS